MPAQFSPADPYPLSSPPDHALRLRSPAAWFVQAAAPAQRAFLHGNQRDRGCRAQTAPVSGAGESARCAALPACAEGATDKTAEAIRQQDRAAPRQAWWPGGLRKNGRRGKSARMSSAAKPPRLDAGLRGRAQPWQGTAAHADATGGTADQSAIPESLLRQKRRPP